MDDARPYAVDERVLQAIADRLGHEIRRAHAGGDQHARVVFQPGCMRTPVPEAWQDGTAALLQAAERRDQRPAGTWTEPARQALIVAWAVLLAALGAAGARGLRQRQQTARVPHGHLI